MNQEITYLCSIDDHQEEITIALFIKQDDFIRLITYIDKSRYELSEITVVNVPVYDDISYFIKKKPDDLITGER